MPFGIIGRTGPGMRQVVEFGDRSTGRGTFGANLGRAVVTNGDFTAYVCDSAATRPSSQITFGRRVIMETANQQNERYDMKPNTPEPAWFYTARNLDISERQFGKIWNDRC